MAFSISFDFIRARRIPVPGNIPSNEGSQTSSILKGLYPEGIKKREVDGQEMGFGSYENGEYNV